MGQGRRREPGRGDRGRSEERKDQAGGRRERGPGERMDERRDERRDERVEERLEHHRDRLERYGERLDRIDERLDRLEGRGR